MCFAATVLIPISEFLQKEATQELNQGGQLGTNKTTASVAKVTVQNPKECEGQVKTKEKKSSRNKAGKRKAKMSERTRGNLNRVCI